MLTVYVDMDDVLCDYSAKIREKKAQSLATPYPQSEPGFFRSLEPLEGALTAIEQLRSRKDIDLYILTAPSTKNPLSYSEKRLWIEDKFGYEMTPKLIICSNKGLLKGDVLIDDHSCGRGQEHFEGKLIHFGQSDYPNWKAVLKYFEAQI